MQRMGNVIHSAARDLDQNIAGNLLSNRSRSCSMAQDLLTLVELKSLLQLLVTLEGVTIKVSQLRYRALQELFGFWISQVGRVKLAPMENLNTCIILLLMIWSC